MNCVQSYKMVLCQIQFQSNQRMEVVNVNDVGREELILWAVYLLLRHLTWLNKMMNELNESGRVREETGALIGPQNRELG